MRDRICEMARAEIALLRDDPSTFPGIVDVMGVRCNPLLDDPLSPLVLSVEARIPIFYLFVHDEDLEALPGKVSRDVRSAYNRIRDRLLPHPEITADVLNFCILSDGRTWMLYDNNLNKVKPLLISSSFHEVVASLLREVDK